MCFTPNPNSSASWLSSASTSISRTDLCELSCDSNPVRKKWLGYFAPKRSYDKRNANGNARNQHLWREHYPLGGKRWASLAIFHKEVVRVPFGNDYLVKKARRSRKQAVEADIQNNHDD